MFGRNRKIKERLNELSFNNTSQWDILKRVESHLQMLNRAFEIRSVSSWGDSLTREQAKEEGYEFLGVVDDMEYWIKKK